MSKIKDVRVENLVPFKLDHALAVAGLSVSDVSRLTGVSRTTLNKLRSDGGKIRASKLSELLRKMLDKKEFEPAGDIVRQRLAELSSGSHEAYFSPDQILNSLEALEFNLEFHLENNVYAMIGLPDDPDDKEVPFTHAQCNDLVQVAERVLDLARQIQTRNTQLGNHG